MTAKQRVVLVALRDAQHEHDRQAVTAGQIAALCPAPWHLRPDLVTQALVCSRTSLNQPMYSTIASSSCERVRQTRSAISSVLKLGK